MITEPKPLDNNYAIRPAKLAGCYEIYGYIEDLRRDPHAPSIVLSEYALHELASRICEPDGCDAFQDMRRDSGAFQNALEQLLAVEWINVANTDEKYWDLCPWCGGHREAGHQPDCPRQAAHKLLVE